MRWKRIPKENARQPRRGCYRDWKEIIAQEGFNQCVYRAIHEASFGGTRNFHVEHYRPKSRFRSLENDIRNLFYACAICNTFKGDSWPAEPCEDHSSICFPNPSEVDYSTLFEVNFSSGVINGKFVASRYLVEQLHLNRHQLLLERRTFQACERVGEIHQVIRRMIDELEEIDSQESKRYLARLGRLMTEISHLGYSLRAIRPYTPEQLRRQI